MSIFNNLIKKLSFITKTERNNTENNENFQREQQEYAFYYDSEKCILQGYIDVAKGTIDRSIQRADFLQKIAAGIGTIFLGVLSLKFNQTQNTNSSIPLTALLSPIFLGISFFTSSIYTSFLTKSKPITPESESDLIQEIIESRRNTFIKWASEAVLNRIEFLQVSVISLGIALITLPFPFIFFKDLIFYISIGIGFFLLFVSYWIAILIRKS